MTGTMPLIVTRPDPGGAATVARARALGFDAHHMPLFAARPLAWSRPRPEAFDALLLTSANAVRLAGEELARLAALPAHAVGEATATAARAVGLTVASTGDSGAQPLLDAMTSRGTGRILWLCGRDHMSLDPHDATLVPLPVYAVDPVAPPHGWAALTAAPAVLMAHSPRAAQRIAELAGPARKHLTLLAISPAAVEKGGEGWHQIIVASHPEDASMLAEAHALCHKGDK